MNHLFLNNNINPIIINRNNNVIIGCFEILKYSIIFNYDIFRNRTLSISTQIMSRKLDKFSFSEQKDLKILPWFWKILKKGVSPITKLYNFYQKIIKITKNHTFFINNKLLNISSNFVFDLIKLVKKGEKVHSKHIFSYLVSIVRVFNFGGVKNE